MQLCRLPSQADALAPVLGPGIACRLEAYTSVTQPL